MFEQRKTFKVKIKLYGYKDKLITKKHYHPPEEYVVFRC